MKHTRRRSRTPLERCVLTATAVMLTLSGAAVGSSVAGVGPAAVTAARSEPAGLHGSAHASAHGRHAAPRTAAPERRFSVAGRPAPTTSTTTAPKTTRPTTTTPAPAAPGTPTGSTAAGTPTATATGTTTGPTSAPATGSTPTGTALPGNPLAGDTFYGPNQGASQAAASGAYSAADTALFTDLASTPTATWLGGWSGDVAQTVRQVVASARAVGAVPVLVAYNIPDTDCGGWSAGGASSASSYGTWVQGLAAGIGSAEAVVVVEPDALAQLCGDPAARYSMLSSAVRTLEANPGTHTYLDAGNPTWINAGDMAARLRAAGVDQADGFSLNVSNFETTSSNVTYGRAVSAALGGAHFVVDTSRNGNGPGTDWCNPGGRAVGARPTAATGDALVDAFLWVKRPGESDGACNGGPSAGTFWAQYALGLMRAR